MALCIVVECPCGLLDGNRSAIAPINLDLIQSVVVDPSGDVAPQSQGQSNSGLLTNHAPVSLAGWKTSISHHPEHDIQKPLPICPTGFAFVRGEVGFLSEFKATYLVQCCAEKYSSFVFPKLMIV
ncbi:hypothetical protein [Bradyrhizobium aeschynomenes]|uniref:hypothetical protein n=1 Tax=Bradyrhizobium aeschynomenes TaxID=2734909 RepID=UPI0015533E20|nr:hypothetical protein [Bradyrhizobium aeschynomenes]NPV21356.1 hypothetical protein [Bradyrhizobium aeschynomenes]